MKISRFLRLGVILSQPGQLRPDTANSYGLDALVSNVNTYAVNLNDLTQSGTDITLTGPQALCGVVRLVGTASNNFTVTLPPTPRLIDALGPTVPRDGSFAVEISVQNEDPTYTATLTAGDSSTTINGTAVVAAGTRRIWLLTVGTPYDYNVVSIQNIGTFSAVSVTPSGGTVTSVAQTVPIEFTVSGSPVTTAGTLAIGKAVETANTVWAGPTTGAAAEPTFRALVLADLPGGVGTGSVTSVGLSMPAEFSVSGSPVTTAGTLAVTKATESANTVWAGPTTGAPAQPTFRALVAADLPASLNLSQTFITQATEATLANSRVLTAGSNITITDGGAGSTITIASSAGGGNLKGQEYTATGAFTFNVPTGVTSVWVTMTGAGGGGATVASTAAQGAGGGGAGEYCVMQSMAATSGGTITGSVGTGGAGGAADGSSHPGATGGDTTCGIFVAKGGLGGNGGTSGAGGGARGGAATGGNGVPGVIGSPESPTYYGGASGGSGGSSTSSGGGAGGPTAGYPSGAIGGSAASTQAGGGGGGSSIYGLGGVGGNGGVAGTSATNYGSGGGGAGAVTAGNVAGGNGAGGYVLIQWIG